MTARVIIVDDEPPARARLARMLAEIGGLTIVGEASDGKSALALLSETRPDIAFVDINMPGGSGLSLAGALREDPVLRDLPIVFLSGRALPGDEPAYEVDLGIYSLTGQRVASLVKGNYPPGAHEATWDGRAASGRRLPPGLYVCRMEVASANGRERLFRKILLR